MKNALFPLLVLVYVLPCFAGSFSDSRDGKTYKTVEIGEQTWMAQNLNYRTGDSWCYDDNADNCQKYGRLYDWKTAMNACPAGWHLPSRIDFEKLQSAVGGQGVAGKKLKSRNDWFKEGNGSDSLGFSALPAGDRYDGLFVNVSRNAFFWSSTEFDGNRAFRLSLDNLSEFSFLLGGKKNYGFSVRCLKD